MKLPVQTSVGCVLVTRNEKAYESNGKKGVSYTLGVVCEGQVAELPCNQLAYDKAGELGQYVQAFLFGEFDTNYKNFKVIHIEKASQK